MTKIKIGWSEVDITPKKGVKIGLAGQFFERITIFFAYLTNSIIIELSKLVK